MSGMMSDYANKLLAGVAAAQTCSGPRSGTGTPGLDRPARPLPLVQLDALTGRLKTIITTLENVRERFVPTGPGFTCNTDVQLGLALAALREALRRAELDRRALAEEGADAAR